MLEQLLQGRRSIRNYNEGSLDEVQVSKLIWSGVGSCRGNKRVAPSAGGCYPLELYFVVGNVKDMETGVYNCKKEILKEGDLRQDLCNAALGQRAIVSAQLIIIIAVNYEKTTQRYGRRGYRYVYMEVGHVGQNIALQAVELGLGTVMIGAFKDSEVKALLGITEDPVYIIPVGLV